MPLLPSERDQRAVRLKIEGLDPGTPLGESFPRLEWAATGTAVGTLANVPSLVQIGTSVGWPWLRSMEWGVVGLVVIGSLGWYRRFRGQVTA